MNSSKNWVLIAVILVVLGYFLPMFNITLFPPITIQGTDSIFVTFVITLTSTTRNPAGLWILIQIPLILALICGLGFFDRTSLTLLRIGFYPTSFLVITLLIIPVYTARMTNNEIFIPLNTIVFVFAALAAHQAKRKLLILLEEETDGKRVSE